MINNSTNFQQIRFGDPLVAGRNLFLFNNKFHIEGQLFTKNFPKPGAGAISYLNFVEKYIPKKLISENNYDNLKKISSNFNGSFTSFFGFESLLTSLESKSDYLIAVSSNNNEREILDDILIKKNHNEKYFDNREWNQIKKFTNLWTNNCSELYDKILGLWFEFDASDERSDYSIPGVFIHTKPIRSSFIKQSKENNWLLNEAIPILQGKNLSKKIKDKIIDCIKNLPNEASIYQVGVMLSRQIEGVRLVIKRIKPNEIIKYLESIGWKDNTSKLYDLIDDLQNKINRFVLHIHVGEQINQRIGIECSFYPDLYHKENRWGEFFNYLKKKEFVNLEKIESLLNFPGLQSEDVLRHFDVDRSVPITKMNNTRFIRGISRFISHIKIIYQPNIRIQVKAYYGVRMLGVTYDTIYH